MLFNPPAVPALDDNGNPIEGAEWRFTLAGTLTPAAVYADADLDTSLGSEVPAVTGGRFPPMFRDPTVPLRARLFDADGVLIPGYDFDPVADLQASDIPTDDDVTVQQWKDQNPLFPRPRAAIENDDTAALQEWAATTGRPLALDGSREYTIAPNALDPEEVILPLSEGVRIHGNGATIKIAAGTSGFHAIIGSDNPLTDLSGLEIEGVVFDHNAHNESDAPVVVANVLTLHRFTVSVLKGTGFRFENNEVLNSVSTNCIFWNGASATSDCHILNNRFRMAEPIDDTNFDHSTIYTTGDNVHIIGNDFENDAFGSANGTCAIEVHPGAQYKVRGNRVSGYHTGINVIGINLSDSTGGVVSGNTLDVLRRGITLRSETYQTHLTGYGLDGLTVDDNFIRIRNATGEGNSDGGNGAFGIMLLGGSSLPTRDVVIGAGNLIQFDLESVAPDWTGIVVMGVGIADTSGTTVHENWHVGSLTIINSPVFGVALGLGGGILKNFSMDAVQIVNPGSTAKSNGDLGSIDYRAGICINLNSVQGSFTIARPRITDDQATSQIRHGMTITCANAVTAPVDIAFDLYVTGGTTTAVAETIYKFDNNIAPKVSVGYNLGIPTTHSGDTFRIGSTLYNRLNGITKVMGTDVGSTFTVNTNYGVLTVGTLPAAATAGAGARAVVTDANATTFAANVAAGGSNVVPVYCDATNWKIG